jgi:23S rRNA (uracil1939-C5)-methyltransferase
MADKGFCAGRTPEGQVIFVEGVVPGDEVDVRVFRRKRKTLFATPTHWHQRSADWAEPFCQHYGVCGGCKWQHFAYAGQLREKEQMVHDAFTRLGKVAVGEWLPILGSGETRYYRNKLEFGCANRRWLTTAEIDSAVSNEENVIGFHKAGAYDKLIQIEHCHLQGEPSNTLRNGIRALAEAMAIPFFDMREKHGLLRQMVVRTTTLGETMLVLAFYADRPQVIEPFLDAIRERFPQITTLVYCINPKVNEFLLDLDMRTYYGPGYIEEQLGAVRFRIGPKSFFQTNSRQAKALYDVAADFAGLSPTDNVYDLYTGIGSIALYLAGRCGHVTGIEEIPEAIEDAKENARLNGTENVTFYAGDVKDILTAAFAEQHGKPDVLITDPPRAGMHPKVVAMLNQLAAPRLVYVSCNPATQARDLQILAERYRVVRARPVDMFPHTSHVENVALLELR